jgi:hypothetical protein
MPGAISSQVDIKLKNAGQTQNNQVVKGVGAGAVPASGEQEMPRGLLAFQNHDTFDTITAAWWRI